MSVTTEAEKLDAKLELLVYLLSVAQKTEGAEVWRALFGEMYASTKRDRMTIFGGAK